MRDLKVIGVEQGSLLLVADSGERFQLPLSELPQQGLRSSQAPSRTTAPDRSVPPREIQRLIRSGLTAEQVAANTGADLEYVRRFEGPVIAEREFIVQSAQAVLVHAAADTGSLTAPVTFGSRIAERLESLAARDERWDSWREADGSWSIQLTFTAHEIDHDARWTFDPRRRSLAPQNTEATALSQQGEPLAPGQPLLPRLRAVDAEPEPDASRFDSGAFRPLVDPEPAAKRGPGLAVLEGQSNAGAATDEREASTAELLESLRRRRGERQPAPSVDDFAGDPGFTMVDVPIEPEIAPEPARPRLTRIVSPVDVDEPAAEPIAQPDAPVEATPTAPLPVQESAPDPEREAKPEPKRNQRNNTTGSLGRRGRASMPSWDEIVFGTRPDEQ